ncbi:hypothetical protein HAX54_033174, partial [Datura stramonium]|nr:hypothetical protein [Datura stramonium]
ANVDDEEYPFHGVPTNLSIFHAYIGDNAFEGYKDNGRFEHKKRCKRHAFNQRNADPYLRNAGGTVCIGYLSVLHRLAQVLL